jgi:starvation-inducible DNA-binding protein
MAAAMSFSIGKSPIDGEEQDMAMITGPLSGDAKDTVADALQGALVDRIDLSLLAKQVHWNVIGTRFRSIHIQLY